ncbi:MAG TPA: hypothetical protein VIM56_00720 [Rhizomicrobium sp.]
MTMKGRNATSQLERDTPIFGSNPVERFVRSSCSINTKDCDTIILQINEHNFLLSYDVFVRHLKAMMANASDFDEQYRQQPVLKN